MDLIGQKIGDLCSEFQAQGYILITVCCLIIGATFAFSEDGTEKLKKRLPFIILGWIIFMGAITLGAKYGASLKF